MLKRSVCNYQKLNLLNLNEKQIVCGGFDLRQELRNSGVEEALKDIFPCPKPSDGEKYLQELTKNPFNSPIQYYTVIVYFPNGTTETRTFQTTLKTEL